MSGMVAKTLSGPTQLTTSAVTQYTVPAATTTRVREIRAVNTSGSAAKVYVSVGADAAPTRVWSGLTVQPNSVLVDDCYLPLAAGTIVQAYSDTGSAITLTLTGVESS